MFRYLRKCTAVLFFAVISTGLAAEPLTFSLQRLVNDKSVTISEQDFVDKYLLMAVGYTACPDICPTTLLDIREAMHELDTTPENAAKVQPLFVTIDPQTDTLKNITQYAAFFDQRIIGLRAETYEQLNHVVEQLRASYGYFSDGKAVQPPNLPKGYTVMHSTLIYLLSPAGKLLDVYPYNIDGKKLAAEIVKQMQS